jgi:hypothetical protein
MCAVTLTKDGYNFLPKTRKIKAVAEMVMLSFKYLSLIRDVAKRNKE